ncbi:hypothetical protein [Pseudonocardia sp.]|uniref:hypothetical protein n=1 Tax=Pseudonocardia sp. TaxID=60912 RepID=UPI00262E9F0D|nr:hypothetical protein [Pseudonocardia sp.]
MRDTDGVLDLDRSFHALPNRVRRAIVAGLRLDPPARASGRIEAHRGLRARAAS